jgi:HSP20 family protein
MTEKNQKKKSQTRSDRDTTALAVPNSGIASIFEDFMRPFDEFIEPFFPRSLRSFWSELDSRQPSLEIHDRGDHFILTAELPGLTKDDVEVRVNPTSLELKAEKKSDNESKNPDGVQQRRSYSSFHQYLSLPEEVVTDKVGGTMKNGILELKLPKKEPRLEEKARRVDLR